MASSFILFVFCDIKHPYKLIAEELEAKVSQRTYELPAALTAAVEAMPAYMVWLSSSDICLTKHIILSILCNDTKIKKGSIIQNQY